MEVFEYENKEKKEKARAVDIISLMGDIAELEDYNGTTKEKIVDNWYDLKRRLREAVTAELPKAEK